MAKLGRSDLDVFPLCLGGNVFGWTADEPQSFAVLDAYAEAGGNFIDSADAYSQWAPGNSGGESEAIIGKWLAARGNRERMVIATKVGKAPGTKALDPASIRAAADNSLRRLGVDYIDLYYAHHDDPSVSLAETLAGLDALVRAGKVRHIAASQYSAPRLAEALAVSAREGLAAYVALQPLYSLVERDTYEGELADTVAAYGLSAVSYYSLASGFLTGKYRPGQEFPTGPRAAGAGRYLDDRGVSVLAALDDIAAAHGVSVAAVSLAWLAAQPTIAAPIASARTVEQLAELLPMADVKLTAAEIARLTDASA